LRQQDSLNKDILNRNQRYDPVLDIMKHPSIKSFAIRGPQNLSRRSSLLSRTEDFSNLRHLDISLHQLQDDISSATYLISKASNLSSLALGTGPLGDDNGYALKAYNGIAEHRTYPISFKDWRLCIPPTPKDSNLSMTTQHSLERLLKVYCGSTLDVDELDEITADIIAKATTNGSAYESLYLRGAGQLGAAFINSLSSIVSRSRLHSIEIYTREDEGRVRILESIQWEHLRKLKIYLKPWTFETSVMQALVDGVKRLSGKVELDEFEFCTETLDEPLTLPEEYLLRIFVWSTSIKKLTLKVDMSPWEILTVDLSGMRILKLWAEDFDAVVDTIRSDLLTHSPTVHTFHLFNAKEEKSYEI
jgi:hypothetical protein